MALIAFTAFLAVASLSDPGKMPDWLLLSWLILVFLLCLATLFFLAQRAYQAVRRRRGLD